MILNPVTIFDDSLVEDAKNLMNKYKIAVYQFYHQKN